MKVRNILHHGDLYRFYREVDNRTREILITKIVLFDDCRTSMKEEIPIYIVPPEVLKQVDYDCYVIANDPYAS